MKHRRNFLETEKIHHRANDEGLLSNFDFILWLKMDIIIHIKIIRTPSLVLNLPHFAGALWLRLLFPLFQS